jgi:hypothetical protein
MSSWKVWLKGLIAAAVSGGANGLTTGFTAMGVDPEHFNFQSRGLGNTLLLAGASALMASILGAAAYLKQSPVPPNGSEAPRRGGLREGGG